MRSFRRSPGAEHLVHAVELPELSRRRRPAAGREEARYAPGTADGNPWGSAAAHHGPNGVNKFRARGAGAPSAAFGRPPSASPFGLVQANGSDAELRELDVPRPAAAGAAQGADAAPVAVPHETSDGQGRIELLERRLVKLARLLAERDEQLQIRIDHATQDNGVASVYSDVQGLRDQSEEALRKRSLMAAIFEANRKLRERVGSTAQDAE